MNQQLTQKEIEKIQDMCFENPKKSCATVQVIIDTCQIVSCATYAELIKKSKRTIQNNAANLIGIKIENRKYISFNQ